MCEGLNYRDAYTIGDVMRAVMAKAKVDWYQWGTDTEMPSRIVLRAITHDNGTFLNSNEDILGQFIWASGTMERWIPFKDFMKALQNSIDAEFGSDQPMAIIRWDE